jgi:hypothetical protein
MVKGYIYISGYSCECSYSLSASGVLAGALMVTDDDADGAGFEVVSLID